MSGFFPAFYPLPRDRTVVSALNSLYAAAVVFLCIHIQRYIPKETNSLEVAFFFKHISGIKL